MPGTAIIADARSSELEQALMASTPICRRSRNLSSRAATKRRHAATRLARCAGGPSELLRLSRDETVNPASIRYQPPVRPAVRAGACSLAVMAAGEITWRKGM